MDQKILLKDQLFNKEAVEKIATRIHKVYSEFDQKSFTKNVLEKFPQLELTPRITWISKNLNIYFS
jgi:hypothetical protein